MKLLMIKFPPLPCYLITLVPKYSPQHPILKHPQPMFLPRCQRPSFTPIQNNRQNYNPLYLFLKILDSKIEDTRKHNYTDQKYRYRAKLFQNV
jgi:hypothetical protein